MGDLLELIGVEMRCEGIIKVAGKQFEMEAAFGIGLIKLDDLWTLVEFSCPLESLPPQGSGTIIGQSFDLKIDKGALTYKGKPVALGKESA